MKTNLLIVLLAFISFKTFAQEEQKVPEAVIQTSRIEMPFSKTSNNITLITKEEIENNTATNVADLLQQVAGVDVRRRGIEGMQSDLYIRGGSFEHVLVLIDGIKTDDAQTGHHTMNIMIPIENIERIEIIKGPAARIYGQNAFNGAINIVTKKIENSQVSLKVGTGTFSRVNAEIATALKLKNSSHQFHYQKNISNGYRYNTDFNNDNFFYKSTFNTNKLPIHLLATFSQRKFGANGFYGAPLVDVYKDQYEEIQTSLIGVSTQYKIKNFTLKPKLYWRRNQDNYFFLRQNPSFFENFHITNKVGAEMNVNYISKLGQTGFGIEAAQTYLSSNNLGLRQRTVIQLFAEQRFELFDGKFDVTPGVAVNYYTDFKFHAFPGLDLGYRINKNVKLYGNVGYTYRIPTYTELYYNSPSTLGNPNLKPESALAGELGTQIKLKGLQASVSGFVRNSNNLIDYVAYNNTDAYEATNIREVLTGGFESSLAYKVKFLDQNQTFKVGYTLMFDKISGLDAPFSRYSLNSAKHHATANLDFGLIKGMRHNLAYKYLERADGTSYNVWDAKIGFKVKSFEISGVLNNIFDTEYSEANLVPMPGRHLLVDLKYTFK